MTGQFETNIRLVREYASDGMSRQQIATALDVCDGYVAMLAKRGGVHLANTSDEKRANRVATLKMCCDQGMTREQAAQLMGLSYLTVARLISQHGIPFVRAGKITEPNQRSIDMAALYKSGKTLLEIGAQYGITRERVRQIINKFHGLNGEDGGAHVLALAKRAKFEAKRNAHSLKKWGCGWEQYVSIRAMKRPTRAYSQQKKNSEQRGIAWELSLWQWWSIWQQSGHWEERGRGRGFQMCRVNDQGGYSFDNVYIAPGTVNIQDYWADVKAGLRTRSVSARRVAKTASPEKAKELQRAAVARYRQTPKGQLRYQLRRQGLPKEQRDAIVAERFGA